MQTRDSSKHQQVKIEKETTPSTSANESQSQEPEVGQIRLEKELDERNRKLTEEELNELLPSDGYEIVAPPEGYSPMQQNQYSLKSSYKDVLQVYEVPVESSNAAQQLPPIKPEDLGYFGALLNQVDESLLSYEDQKDRKIMALLLKIKNGDPLVRKNALKQISEHAKELGAAPLFNQIIPLLHSPTLEEQERHLLCKTLDRVIVQLQDSTIPFLHKIMNVISPMLVEEDFYARAEAREVISNVSKACGASAIIQAIRPDLDHADDHIRDVAARTLAVAAASLGVKHLLAFISAVCNSKKWQARHTGVKVVQQISILLGCGVLPYLRDLVNMIANGLKDEQVKVKIITSLALASLAEASAPFGIEAFEQVLQILKEQLPECRSRNLAAMLKAIGFMIPLMEEDICAKYVKDIMPVIKREFRSHDDDMKTIILKVLKQVFTVESITSKYINENLLNSFLEDFWTRRIASEKKNYKQLIETTVALSHKIGGTNIINSIVSKLKESSEVYRKMAIETIEQIILALGTQGISSQLEKQIIDGILFVFSEQGAEEHTVILNAFSNIINAFGMRAKAYIPNICGTIQWRLNNKQPKVRQQAADLISKIAYVMKLVGEELLLQKLGQTLYDYLNEEYPDVLGSILAALKAIVNVIGMSKMQPPIKDLLPRLTPVLKNRHEKVQENCIDLVGRIADRGSEFVGAKEWMRICFDLLDLLKAHKKGIRRAAVSTFGYIARAIGPQDVIATLLNNLKVQERQNRICTTVAIAIVAEACGPFTVLPALMNEYRMPENNVQNGVLKSLSFLFEYIGESAKDYMYAIIPLLEDALMDRDNVHRQTACVTIKHLALSLHGMGYDDALLHLFNFVWPNIFEQSPHVFNAVIEAIEGMRVSLGCNIILMYLLQGLFHPSRRVREVYWKIYNICYNGNCDSMNQGYPYVPDHNRAELELFI